MCVYVCPNVPKHLCTNFVRKLQLCRACRLAFSRVRQEYFDVKSKQLTTSDDNCLDHVIQWLPTFKWSCWLVIWLVPEQHNFCPFKAGTFHGNCHCSFCSRHILARTAAQWAVHQMPQQGSCNLQKKMSDEESWGVTGSTEARELSFQWLRILLDTYGKPSIQWWSGRNCMKLQACTWLSIFQRVHDWRNGTCSRHPPNRGYNSAISLLSRVSGDMRAMPITPTWTHQTHQRSHSTTIPTSSWCSGPRTHG